MFISGIKLVLYIDQKEKEKQDALKSELKQEEIKKMEKRIIGLQKHV